ncbi:60S ribosomal L21-2-like [Olea europaea subsp. europaea]|uniref:60S ribosomal L21-2-like n=1 Tax=Olea europaea subsp. europaea TaxID=158383 RepID=A0A8S0V2Q1_OLEEU|nr:60S ribosomal L21-2-like [Olea europaea subsp. europaea]
MLLDQSILIEMRLRTMKLEIIQHVTEEFARLKDSISSLVSPSNGTSTSAAVPVVNEPNIWDDPHEDEKGSDERSSQDDDHADEGEANDGKGEDERSPQDDDHGEEGDMQEAAHSFGGLIFELIVYVHRGVMMNFCRLVKTIDKMKAEAKRKGVVISTKKQPKGPKLGFMPKDATVETITPIPYDVVNDLKGGY